ncbi:MAG: Mu transposase domain-containing protein [Streptosporangiaceae bacterium]
MTADTRWRHQWRWTRVLARGPDVVPYRGEGRRPDGWLSLLRSWSQRPSAIGEDFAAEAPFLLPLPPERFDTAATLWPRADRYARIAVGKCRYSVPARLIDTRVRVRLSANQMEVCDGSRLAAVHPRLTAAGAGHLDLDHYLKILVRKPGALPGSAVLAQARAAGPRRRDVQRRP